MPDLKEKPTNFNHFLYGLGVIIILLAAGFYALGFEYARYLFALGLGIEIVLFLLTVIELRPEESYDPEISFPTQKKVDVNTGAEFFLLQEDLQNLRESLNHLNQIADQLYSKQKEKEFTDSKSHTMSAEDIKTEIEKLRSEIGEAYAKLKSIDQQNAK